MVLITPNSDLVSELCFDMGLVTPDSDLVSELCFHHLYFNEVLALFLNSVFIWA